MRRIVLFFVLMIMGIGMIFAQSGQKLSYQAVIRNSANQLVTNTQLEVTIGIANSENDAAVYTEHHTVTTNANGLISLMIGTGDNRTGNWDQIEWDHAYVTTNTVVDGVPVSHRVELTAVAHAFYADNVDEVTITEVLNDHGIVDGAEPNVQGDWNQENTGADDYIKNKPNFNNVAISGDYNDLSNKPDLDQYATNVHLNDTLNNYLTIDGLCDSIKNCEVIANLQTADSLLGVRITRDSIALSQKIYSDSAYLKRLIDSTTVIITNNTTNITNNTTNISNITNNITSLQVADSLLNARFARDSIALSKRLDTMFTHVCDSIEQCEVIQNMRDSIRANAADIQTNATNIANIRTDITNLQNADAALSSRITADSILSYKADSVLSARITADSTNLANNYYNKIKINDTVAYILSQINNTSGNLNDNYYTKPEINDTLSHYTTSDEIDSLLGNYAKKDTLENYLTIDGLCDSIKKCEVITNLQNADSLLSARITRDSILSYKADSVLAVRITADSILSYKSDSVLSARIIADSILFYKADSVLLSHILTDSILSYRADSALLARILKDSVVSYRTDSVLLARILNDSALSYKADSVLLALILKDSANLANNYYTKAEINDTLSHYTTTDNIDSLLRGYATNDTLKNYLTISGLCDSIKNCEVITDLQNADSLLSVRITRDSVLSYKTDSALAVRMINDSVLFYKTDSVLLAHILNDSVLSHQADSILLARILNDSANLANNYYTTAKINDTLSYYTTTDNIDSLLRGYATNDTLNKYLTISGLCDSIKNCEVIQDMRDSIRANAADIQTNATNIANIRTDITNLQNADAALSARITADSILSYKADSVLSARITADSTNLANNYYNKIKINDTVAYILSQINNTSGNLNDNYYTKPEINDTLSHYTTTDNIDSLLRGYATNDTLNKYLTISGLCDSIKSCEVITDLQNADSLLSVRITRDSVLSYKADSALAVRMINDSVLFYKTDSVLLVHILNDSVLSHQADSILLARILNDSVNLANNYYTTAKINDTLSHYTTTDNIDSLLRGYATNDTLKNYLTIDGLCDSIKKCEVIQNMRDSIRANAADIQTNATNIANIRTDITNLQNADAALSARITADSTNLANNYYNKIKINDTVAYILSQMANTTGNLNDNYYTKPEINDTLGHYTTTDHIDSLLRDYAKSDTLKNYLTIDGLCDSIKKCEVITNLQNADSLLSARITRDSILSYKADSILAARITRDSILSYKADSILAASIATNTASITNNITTITENITNNTTNITNLFNADSALAVRVHNDSVAFSKRMDTLLTHVCDSIEKCGIISELQTADSLLGARITRDSILSYKADSVLTARITRDSIVSYKADSVLAVRIIADSILSYKADSALAARLTDTARKIREDFPKVSDKTIILKQGNDTIGRFTLNQEIDHTLTIPTPPDAQVQSDWNQTTTTEKDYIKHKPNIRDSVNVVILDSLAAANSAINKAIDTIAGHVIHDSLGNYAIKNCEDVNACVATAIGNNNSAINQAIDTIARHNIHDTAMVIRTHIRDSVNRVVLDSLVAANSAINKAIDTIAGNAIHDSLGNGTLTISYGTVDSVKFTANQKTNGRITIPAQVNADWNATEGPSKIENKPEILTVNDATLTIQKNGTTVGTFTANQATGQTIDIKVPTCDSLAECDLIISILARLDRLERANDSLAKEIEKLQPALTVSGPQKDTVCAGSTKSLTYTATFHNCSSSDYTLAWKVNGTDSSNVTGSKLILNVETAGQYVVVCIATRSDSTFVTDTVTTTVTVDNDVPSFTIAIEGLKVTLSDVVNTATIQWDTDSLPVPSSGTSVTHTYAVADTITITAISERGCTFTKDTILQPIKPEVTTVSIPTETIKATEAKVNGKLNSDGGIPTTRRGVLYSISNSTPRLGAAGVDSVINGAGMGDFTCDLRRLVPCSPYYVCAFAINEVDTAYGEVMTFSTPSFTCGDTLIDIDDNKYATLLLGSQCWMKQNLRTTHFADGTEIPKGGVYSSSFSQPFYYEPDSNINTYGRLYNWTAAMNRSASSSANPSGVQGVCPDGWHLPSDAEWTQLTSFVASDSANVCDGNPINIAKALASNEGWEYFDTSSVSVECYLVTDVATNNKTQFSVLPTGTWEVGSKAGYTNYGHSIYRTATEYEQVQYQSAYARQFYGDQAFVERTAPIKEVGYSVRCVLDCATGHTYLPTVSPVSLTQTSGTTVNMAASVVSDGDTIVTERGVCWGTASQPTTGSDHTASGTGIGDFSVNVTSLTPGTTYYVRAYATNSEGTAYGAEVIYVAPNPVYPPVVNTGSQFLALSEGFEDLSRIDAWSTIDNDGDGKNWGITNQKAHNGTLLCAYSASWLSGVDLQPDNYFITPDIIIPSDVSPILTFWHRGSENSLYWAQEHFLVMVGNAGASTANDFNDTLLNSTSTNEYLQATVDLSAYVGQTISLAFVHSTNVSKNRLLIDDIEVGVAGASAGIVSDVTATTANCGGFVSGDGGATVTARGVCWSTSENPTVSDNHTTDGSGTGSFTSNITGLSATTTYYVRAYAINSADTSYGDQVSFTTLEALPKVTTSAVSNINVSGTNITATCGGDVTDQGAYEVTARGVCWGTSDPTIDSCHTDDGSGLHSFVSSLTGLSSGTTYYVRAYATNSAGTAYGNQVSFTLPVIDTNSCDEARTVTDHEGNVYATVKIGTQCWMRENLRTTTSPKTGTYLVNTEGKTGTNRSSYYGSKVAHWYNNDSTLYASKGYGLLYNWCAAVDTANPDNYVEVPTTSNNGNNTYFTITLANNHRGICPAGWHLPSYDELNSLSSKSPGSLQVVGDFWSSSADNSTGFTAYPAGYFGNGYQTFRDEGVGHRTYFWSWFNNSDKAQTLYLQEGSVQRSLFEKNCGASVRCIKNE